MTKLIFSVFAVVFFAVACGRGQVVSNRPAPHVQEMVDASLKMQRATDEVRRVILVEAAAGKREARFCAGLLVKMASTDWQVAEAQAVKQLVDAGVRTAEADARARRLAQDILAD